ncbi:MAG TPA: pyridoxal phosphate-dependent aminotransferase [Terriglobales bacterium]
MFAERTNWNLSPNPLAEALARHRASGRTLVDLSASNPTECGFDYDRRAILGSLQQPGVLEYHPDPRGLESARQSVREYYAARGDDVAVDSIILTTSTSEAYSFVFRLLCNPGDELLIPAPSYPLFDFLADIEDVKLVRYALFYDHGWHIDVHALEQAIRSPTKGVIVVHPNNPTGHFTKDRERERLNQICAAHRLAIVADEVFLDFSLSSARPLTFSVNHDALTFTMSGLSKISGLPQMKLAWLIVSGPEKERREALDRLEVIADTYLSLNAPVELAAKGLLAQRHGFQKQLMTRVRQNLAELDQQLATNKSCARLEVEAGWYAVLRVPATRPDQELAIELLERDGVYLHPGHFYGFPLEGYLVVSLIAPPAIFALGIRHTLARL